MPLPWNIIKAWYPRCTWHIWENLPTRKWNFLLKTLTELNQLYFYCFFSSKNYSKLGPGQLGKKVTCQGILQQCSETGTMTSLNSSATLLQPQGCSSIVYSAPEKHSRSHRHNYMGQMCSHILSFWLFLFQVETTSKVQNASELVCSLHIYLICLCVSVWKAFFQIQIATWCSLLCKDTLIRLHEWNIELFSEWANLIQKKFFSLGPFISRK